MEPVDPVDDLMEGQGKRALAEEVVRLRGLLGVACTVCAHVTSTRDEGRPFLLVCDGCGTVVRQDGTPRSPGPKPPSLRHPGA